MELLFELLLTAAATLLVACLLAKLFSSSSATADPRHDRAAAGPAGVIAVDDEEEERIIEVDEVRVERAAAPSLSEGWVEVEKAPAAAPVAVAAEGKAAWVAVEEGVPAALAPELFLGTVLEERKEEGEVGKTPRDLTAATEVAAEAKLRDLGDEAAAAPREIPGFDLVKETAHQQHDLAAQAAPAEVLDAELQKHEAGATQAVVLVAEAAPAEVIDAGPEEEEEGAQAVEAIPRELASEAVPAEVIDAGLEGEVQEQDAQVIPHELASESAPGAVLDAVPEKPQQQEEQVIEVDQHESAAEVAPRATPHMVARELASEAAPRTIPDAVATEEELKEQPAVEVVVDQHEQVQNKEEAQCELSPVDQQEKPVPEEELVAKKAGDLNVSQEGSSNDKADVQLPEKDVTTLLGMPEDEANSNMEFEEWEGIERSEVEKRFGAAAAFAASEAGAAALSKLDSDVQLQMQGLLKVAVDGPCYDSAQPLTLRPSSRAKWVSWQKLGNMHPEIAMGKYMDLLSEFIPRWMGDKTSSTKEHEGDADSDGAALTMAALTSDPQTKQGNEGSTSIDEGPLTGPNPEKGQSCGLPAE